MVHGVESPLRKKAMMTMARSWATQAMWKLSGLLERCYMGCKIHKTMQVSTP